MIQRIQTLFLLGAIILIVLCYFIPIAVMAVPEGEIYQFSMNGYYIVKGDIKEFIQPLVSLKISGFIMIGLLLVTILLYKARHVQMRLSIYSIILLVGLNLIFLYIIKTVKSEMLANVYYNITILFPVIAAILVYLAFRRIKKDDEMVKSYDRLR